MKYIVLFGTTLIAVGTGTIALNHYTNGWTRIVTPKIYIPSFEIWIREEPPSVQPK